MVSSMNCHGVRGDICYDENQLLLSMYGGGTHNTVRRRYFERVTILDFLVLISTS